MDQPPAISLRIDFAPGVKLGPGKIRLLELIDREGSISAAARELGMSYRRAWLLVEDANQLFGAPLVEGMAGGAKGGGARVTALGRHVIAAYRDIERQTAEIAQRQFDGLTKRGEIRD